MRYGSYYPSVPMKYLKSLFIKINTLFFATVLLVACNGLDDIREVIGYYPPSPDDQKPVSIYPGECLNQVQIGYVTHLKTKLYSSSDTDDVLCVVFKLYWDVETEHVNRTIYRAVPSKAIYKEFGKDARKVKQAYDELFDEYFKDVDVANWDYRYHGINTTLYYCGGIVVKANQEFAGIPAWTNLESATIPFSDNPDKYGLTPIPTIGVPEGYSIIGDYIGIYFPLEGRELVDGEEVTFHLEIPVKVGLMLTLLRDRLTNPDAQMQYRDEVLTCDFTLNHGLH